MVNRKNILGPIIFVIIFLLALPIIIYFNKRGSEKYQLSDMHGKVETVIYKIRGERGFFIIVNNDWYNIVDIEAQEYILAGDSLSKEKGRKCFTIYRDQYDYKEICNSIIHKVNSVDVLNKLNQESRKKRPNRRQ